MQFVHGDLRTRAQHLFDGIRTGADRFIDGALLVLASVCQHEVDHIVLRARVPDADTQAPEGIALRGNEIAQAIVPTVTAGLLEPYRPAGQIDFIMRHQHFGGRNLVEPQHARHRATAAVHESHGLGQPDLLAANSHAREFGLVLALVSERAAMSARQFVHQPEAGVVARARVFGPGIAETHDELDDVASHVEMPGPRKKCGATKFRRAAQ